MKNKRIVSYLSLALSFIFVLAAFSACTKTEADTTRILDFRAEEDVTPMSEYPVAEIYGEDNPQRYYIYKGGLRDETYVVVDEIGLTGLTGIEFPSPDGKLDLDRAKALYDAARELYRSSTRVILANGQNQIVLRTVTDEEKKTLLNDPRSFDSETLNELLDGMTQERRLTAAIFWELVDRYLPEGACGALPLGNVGRNSPNLTYAAADLASSGYSSFEEIKAKYSYSDLPFDAVYYNEYSEVWYYSASDRSTVYFDIDEYIPLMTIIREILGV